MHYMVFCVCISCGKKHSKDEAFSFSQLFLKLQMFFSEFPDASQLQGLASF